MSKTPGQVCFAGAVVSEAAFQKALDTRGLAKLGGLKTTSAPPHSDNSVRAQIAALEAENVRMRAAAAKRDPARMRANIEAKAKESAEQLYRQMQGNKYREPQK